MSAYNSFIESVIAYEATPHYTDIMCMKETTCGPRANPICDTHVSGSEILPNRANLKHLCVLPPGHTGACSHKFRVFDKDNKQAKKIDGSVDLAIYSTPGNDDYVFKNRSSRLSPIVLSHEEQKKIRDKNVKKKCAIPLKDTSTPILLAQAYLDWMTFVLKTRGVQELGDPASPNYATIMNMVNNHATYLCNIFAHRKIFDQEGHSICVITQATLRATDLADPTRDNRVDIRDSDVQLGHNVPRSDDHVSIRGGNLFPMSRRGNLIIGENVFTENAWIEELRSIISPYDK